MNLKLAELTISTTHDDIYSVRPFASIDEAFTTVFNVSKENIEPTAKAIYREAVVRFNAKMASDHVTFVPGVVFLECDNCHWLHISSLGFLITDSDCDIKDFSMPFPGFAAPDGNPLAINMSAHESDISWDFELGCSVEEFKQRSNFDGVVPTTPLWRKLMDNFTPLDSLECLGVSELASQSTVKEVDA